MKKKEKNQKKSGAPGTGKKNEPPERVVETVQDSIPILCCHDRDNLIQSYEGQYSRMYQISEVNYQTLSETEQEQFFERYRALLNSMDPTVEFAITLHNRSIDMASFEDAVLARERGDDLDPMRRQMNRITLDRVREGKNGIRTDKYFTVSIHAPSLAEARSEFHRLDRDLDLSFQKIGSSARPVSAEDRLDALFNFYNPGHAGEFLAHTKVIDEQGVSRDVPAFDFGNLRAMGLTVADVIAPSSIVYHSDYIEVGDCFARSMSVSNYPSILGDDFLTGLCSSNYSIIATLNVKPMTNAAAERLVGLNLTMVRAERTKAQKQALADGASEDMINPQILERENEALNLRDDMRERDEHLFETNLTFVVFADSQEQLKEYSDSIISEGRKRSVVIQTMVGLQDIGFVSTLPLCCSLMKQKRTFKSSSVAALMPFSVTELNNPDGINYSMNAVTRNLVLYDRKSQFNANGFILGTSGSGKSFAAKTEMLNVLLKTDDDVIVIDPEAEYGPLCEAVEGSLIRIVPGGADVINPMSIFVDRSGAFETDPVLEKVDFILNLCNIIVKSAWGIDSVQETIIDECIHGLFAPFYTQSGRDGRRMLREIDESEMPTLTDLYRKVAARPEPEAREVAYALQLYTGNGSLAVFGGQTTVDMDNRFVVFDINSLGRKLTPVAMQIILDAIWQRIVRNRALGRHTWFYVDEVYLLFRNEISAEWLQQLWKRARKYGGVPTGITQNVEDLLNSETARSMLANSSFIEILNQAPTDRERLRELLHLSQSQCGYITDAPRGQGIICTGTQAVPIFSLFPRDNDVYRVLTSDLSEIRRYREEEYRKKHFGGEADSTHAA